MAAISSLSHNIHDITSCSLCLETFKEPKLLPCIHTFCLQCLDSYCKTKNEKEVSCPFCKAVFSIPPGGIKDLPNNFFILRLLNVNISPVDTGMQESDKPTLCEQPGSDSEAEVAASFSVECDRHTCDRCSGIHKKVKLSKFHQAVGRDKIPESEQSAKLPGDYCDQHPRERNILYCYDCNTVTCLECKSKHSRHKCSSVSEWAQKFRQLLNEDIDKVSKCVVYQQANLKQIEVGRDTFYARITSAESEISQKYDSLISIIQSHKSQLLDELNQFKRMVVKRIESSKVEIERQFVIRESFKRYCQEMMNKGTACDISRAARDLHARAKELVKTQDEPDCQKLSGVEITFKPSLSTTDSMKNFIGELILRGGAADVTKYNQIKEEIGLTKSFVESKLLHVMRSTGRCISGITIHGNDLLVVRHTPLVYVYKSDDFTYVRDFEITGSEQLEGLVSCSHYNCLYAVDPLQRIIYKYAVSSEVTTNWSVGDRCCRLSLSKCHNVLATLMDAKRIREYATDGSMVRDISLDSDIDNPWHCVQLSTGNYVVCHAGTRQHRVCVVDQSGRIVQLYENDGRLLNPCYLAVDVRDRVLICSCDNNRIQLLSSTLTYLGDVVIPGEELNDPYTLHFDELNHRLYIGETSMGGSRIFVLDVRINDDTTETA